MPQVKELGIVGLGLIGASVAAAARSRNVAGRIVGVEINPEHRDVVRGHQWVDEVTDDLATVANCDLVVIATPPRVVAAKVLEVLEASPEAILTDTAGVKLRIGLQLGADETRARSRYVPGHPMAGTEWSGPTHANPELFVGSTVLLCPGDIIEEQAASVVGDFWKALGSTPFRCDVGDHDLWIGAVSHAPHLIAFALARMALDRVGDPKRVAKISGPTFKGMTRVAASDPALWTELFMMNREAVAAAALQFTIQLDELVQALRKGDEETLRSLLEAGQRARYSVFPPEAEGES